MTADRYPALARSRIPFEVVNTDALVRHLMAVAESRPFLDEYLGTPQEVKLLRRAKIRAITSSNQIEGNRLDEQEVTAVIQGERVAGPSKDVQEVRNCHEALGYVETLAEDRRPLRLSDLVDIQKLVTRGLVPGSQSGRARTIQVSIVNSSTGERLQDCPEPHLLPELLEDLWKWLDDTREMNPFLRACTFHFIGVAIHPFVDGNGRTMRLMQHLLLLRGGERVARLVPSETAILRNRDRYYSSIRESIALGRLSPILEFLIESFSTSAREVVDEGRKLLRQSAGRTPDARHRKILSHAAKREFFTIQDVQAWMPDVPRRTLERDLALLVRKKDVLAKGRNKARAYRVADTEPRERRSSKKTTKFAP